ncbi:cytochrome c oxidase assembly protein COX14 homolog [Myxocyprinus asiaticus]|uniref:cytochrome c oxidase assembly protein COX14 homolog n=1 Tax=Myxocyprinus asiaticus TaxID=70543 RepID=UPI002223890B|nr:cytochrome c oxidase assembly protein COX14 homolog [Myxocyprinus asiaticus]
MSSGKRIADVGYRLFSGSMMLLTVYGGYLCVMRAQRYMQKRKQLELAAQNESTTSESIKD